MQTFGNQISLRIAARAIGVEYDAMRKWRQRHGLFGVPGHPKRELTVPEVCALRVAALVLHRCRGLTVREALDVSARLAIPAFEALLTGEMATETIELTNGKTGEQIVISLGDVIADVLHRLGLGFVSFNRGENDRARSKRDTISTFNGAPQ